MGDYDSDLVRETIIENQIAAGIPPETKQTLECLTAEGHSKEEAMRLIGCVVASEIFAVLKEGRMFDEASYVGALLALPVLPWESRAQYRSTPDAVKRPRSCRQALTQLPGHHCTSCICATSRLCFAESECLILYKPRNL